MSVLRSYARSLVLKSFSKLFRMFNPLSLLVPPAVVLLSIPLAAFAVFTTITAVTILSIRVSIVYFELGVAILQRWLFGDNSKKAAFPSPASSSPTWPRSRRGSSHQATYLQSSSSDPWRRSDSFASLIGTTGVNRDYEGVAGWKDTAGNVEEALWIGMNSRLELPGGIPAEHKKRHQRSHTGGSIHRRSSGSMRMSPVQSRARTPQAVDLNGATESYFNILPHGRRPNTAEGGSNGKHRRRKSSSGSSSSGGSRLAVSAILPGGY